MQHIEKHYLIPVIGDQPIRSQVACAVATCKFFG